MADAMAMNSLALNSRYPMYALTDRPCRPNVVQLRVGSTEDAPHYKNCGSRVKHNCPKTVLKICQEHGRWMPGRQPWGTAPRRRSAPSNQNASPVTASLAIRHTESKTRLAAGHCHPTNHGQSVCRGRSKRPLRIGFRSRAQGREDALSRS